MVNLYRLKGFVPDNSPPDRASQRRRARPNGSPLLIISVLPIALTACSLATVTRGEVGLAAVTDQQMCDRPLGRIVVVGGDNSSLKEQGLPPIEPLVGLLARQSNCFFVAKRGESVEQSVFREQQNMGMTGNKLAGAEYSLVTTIMFVGNTGKQKWGSIIGGTVGTLGAQVFPKWNGLLSEKADAVINSDQAEVVLSLVENGSGLEIGAAAGTATATDVDLGGSLSAFWSKNKSSGTVSTYEKTPAGRLVSAALMDAFNKLVATMQPESRQIVAESISTRAQ